MNKRLFDDLMHLFKQQFSNFCTPNDLHLRTSLIGNLNKATQVDDDCLVIKDANPESTRVFTSEELVRFTKASHQFLVRLNKMGVFSSDYVEMVINHLLLSGSKVISLSETKWVLRDFISDELTNSQLAFLDLVLYQKEDQVSIQ